MNEVLYFFEKKIFLIKKSVRKLFNGVCYRRGEYFEYLKIICILFSLYKRILIIKLVKRKTERKNFNSILPVELY